MVPCYVSGDGAKKMNEKEAGLENMLLMVVRSLPPAHPRKERFQS